MTEQTTERTRFPWQPTLLLVLFLGPLIAAVALYYSGGWRPAGSTNHGILVQPPVTLPQLSPVGGVREGYAGDLRGRWTLLYVDPGRCTERCAEALFRGHQARQVLGRRQVRIERLYIYQGEPPPDSVLVTDEALRVMPGSDAEAARVIAAIPPAVASADELLLVDPLGNLMMRFPLEGDPKDMVEDLKKLLKLSRIG
ncbi:MAG: hypothetical protein PVG91_02885 [Gammaproteobacteria bacterium]|jgi:hypothetical protein